MSLDPAFRYSISFKYLPRVLKFTGFACMSVVLMPVCRRNCKLLSHYRIQDHIRRKNEHCSAWLGGRWKEESEQFRRLYGSFSLLRATLLECSINDNSTVIKFHSCPPVMMSLPFNSSQIKRVGELPLGWRVLRISREHMNFAGSVILRSEINDSL